MIQSGDLVSIVVPVYNREATLQRLFASLRNVDYPNLEVILVDNHSSDGSLLMCKEFASKYSRDGFVVTVLSEEKKGAAAARNAGLSACNGAFVSFFDSDDEMSPDFISDMVLILKRDNVDFAFAPTVMVMQDGSLVKRASTGKDILVSHILSSMISTQSFVAKTDFVKRIGGWNASLHTWDDYELGVRIARASDNFSWTPKAYHKIYQHDESISGQPLHESFADIRRNLAAVEQDVAGCDTRTQFTLYLRERIVTAEYRRHGLKEEAGELGKMAHALLCGSVKSSVKRQCLKFIGFLMYAHHACGRRGAWRLSLFFVKALSSVRLL